MRMRSGCLCWSQPFGWECCSEHEERVCGICIETLHPFLAFDPETGLQVQALPAPG